MYACALTAMSSILTAFILISGKRGYALNIMNSLWYIYIILTGHQLVRQLSNSYFLMVQKMLIGAKSSDLFLTISNYKVSQKTLTIVQAPLRWFNEIKRLDEVIVKGCDPSIKVLKGPEETLKKRRESGEDNDRCCQRTCT